MPIAVKVEWVRKTCVYFRCYHHLQSWCPNFWPESGGKKSAEIRNFNRKSIVNQSLKSGFPLNFLALIGNLIVEMQIDPLLLSNPTKHLIGKSAKFRPGNPGEIRNFNRKSTEAVRYPAKNLDINFANGDSHTFPTTVKTILADHGNHKSLSVLTLTKERIFLGGVARFRIYKGTLTQGWQFPPLGPKKKILTQPEIMAWTNE